MAHIHRAVKAIVIDIYEQAHAALPVACFHGNLFVFFKQCQKH